MTHCDYSLGEYALKGYVSLVKVPSQGRSAAPWMSVSGEYALKAFAPKALNTTHCPLALEASSLITPVPNSISASMYDCGPGFFCTQGIYLTQVSVGGSCTVDTDCVNSAGCDIASGAAADSGVCIKYNSVAPEVARGSLHPLIHTHCAVLATASRLRTLDNFSVLCSF